MILYVNGDSHAAGAEAANGYSFADDDIQYVTLGKRPHPDNLNVSWGMRLSKILNLGLNCDAESGSSNDRIIRTTNEFIGHWAKLGRAYTVVVIGWTTWQREERYDIENSQWQQVNTAGSDYYQKETEAHKKIYELHQQLSVLQIPHLFFNAQWHFSPTQDSNTDWHGCYLDPYNAEMSYSEWAVINGYGKNRDQYFGPEAHRKWADLLSSRLTPLLQAV